MRMLCDPPAPMKVVRASSTSLESSHGSGVYGQCAGLDSHDVDEVRQQLDHVIGLLFDDPVELVRLCGVQRTPLGAQGGRGPLDGHQRGAQLVPDHSQKLRAQALRRREGRHVQRGDHHCVDLAVAAEYGSGVDDRIHLAAVGVLKRHLLAAHGLHRCLQRKLLGGDPAAVGAPGRCRLRPTRPTRRSACPVRS